MLEPLQTPSTDNDEDGHSADMQPHLHAMLTSFQCDCTYSQTTKSNKRQPNDSMASVYICLIDVDDALDTDTKRHL